ncbi:MAG: hypothetical protein Q7U04_13500 [Bacteriovorax sp.]|nr:hypothetical protein [Bacteriovorax sp.]
MKFKMMICFVAAVVSSSIFAASSKDDWSKLRRNHDVLIIQPGIAMTMGPTGVFNACATSQELRSIHPVKSCTAYKLVVHGNPKSDSGSSEYVCTNYELKDVVIARDHEETVCLEYSPTTEINTGECIKWATVQKTYPRNFNLEVVATGEFYMGHLFDKSFSLPECDM